MHPYEIESPHFKLYVKFSDIFKKISTVSNCRKYIFIFLSPQLEPAVIFYKYFIRYIYIRMQEYKYDWVELCHNQVYFGIIIPKFVF